MPKLYAPEDYILSRADKYPSLYSSNSYNEARLRVLDQLLNVIGNGIRDHNELVEELTVRPFNSDRAMRVCTGETVYYGYFEVDPTFEGFKMPIGKSVTALESEKDQHPTVIHWQETRANKTRADGLARPWNPYPNFKKDYSTIYQTNFKSLGPEWAAEVVWFYQRCWEYFEGNYSSYHGAYPCSSEFQTQKLIEDMTKYRAKYATDEEFAKSYMGEGAVFNGDMHQFLLDRWDCTLTNIRKFIKKAVKDYGG